VELAPDAPACRAARLCGQSPRRGSVHGGLGAVFGGKHWGAASRAEILAEKYVQGEASAVKKVNEILAGRIGAIQHAARQSKAEKLVQEYARHTANAVALIDELLTGAGLNVDALMADALTDDGLVKRFDSIERFERLTAVAESRLSARLREIEQRRAIFGATLRGSVQEIEDSERSNQDQASQRKKVG
jgi:hypothetical protein